MSEVFCFVCLLQILVEEKFRFCVVFLHSLIKLYFPLKSPLEGVQLELHGLWLLRIVPDQYSSEFRIGIQLSF